MRCEGGVPRSTAAKNYLHRKDERFCREKGSSGQFPPIFRSGALLLTRETTQFGAYGSGRHGHDSAARIRVRSGKWQELRLRARMRRGQAIEGEEPKLKYGSVWSSRFCPGCRQRRGPTDAWRGRKFDLLLKLWRQTALVSAGYKIQTREGYLRTKILLHRVRELSRVG